MRMGTTRPPSSVTQRVPSRSLETAPLLRDGGSGKVLQAVELRSDLRRCAGGGTARRSSNAGEPLADFLDEAAIDSGQGKRVTQNPCPLAVVLRARAHRLLPDEFPRPERIHLPPRPKRPRQRLLHVWFSITQ